MDSKKKESRKFLRVKTKLPIRYQMKRGGFSAAALSEDLSLSGAGLNADRSFPSGLNLNLELNILLRIITTLRFFVIYLIMHLILRCRFRMNTIRSIRILIRPPDLRMTADHFLR